MHAEDGSTSDVPLPLEVKGLRGFGKFFELTITDPDGKVVQQRNRPFCPNSWGQQRVDPDGSDRSTFPEGCYGLRFAIGTVWGIDSGWASPALGESGVVLDGRNGRYRVTLTVRSPTGRHSASPTPTPRRRPSSGCARAIPATMSGAP